MLTFLRKQLGPDPWKRRLPKTPIYDNRAYSKKYELVIVSKSFTCVEKIDDLQMTRVCEYD